MNVHTLGPEHDREVGDYKVTDVYCNQCFYVLGVKIVRLYKTISLTFEIALIYKYYLTNTVLFQIQVPDDELNLCETEFLLKM